MDPYGGASASSCAVLASPYAVLMNSAHGSSQESAAMTISLNTISSIFAPSASTSSGQSFLDSLGGSSDPITDNTLALGKAVSQALGNAEINQVQGKSSIAANTAVKRIQAQIVAKKKEQAAKAKEAIAALDIFQKNHKVNKTA
jgi:hypothetical protein